MAVMMDMKALEFTLGRIAAATDLTEDNDYVVAVAMGCSDATYDQMMMGPAQMTEAQCCVAAWSRLFRCDSRPVDGRDVAFAMSAFSIPELDAALYAIDSFLPVEDGGSDAYKVLTACLGPKPTLAVGRALSCDAVFQRCAELLKTCVVKKW